MATIAIIGPDGAGKTTVTQLIVNSSRHSFKHIYMGLNIEASNFALPTTRWAERIKRRMEGKGRATLYATTRNFPRKWLRRFREGRLAAAVGLLIAMTDDWFRQLVSWYYQWRGFIVIYDRHFVFDLVEQMASASHLPIAYRIRLWYLKYFYPRPDLVIFLDAPPEVLYARKKEWSIEDLERKRQGFLRVGSMLPNLHRIDASQALEEVHAQVTRKIEEFAKSRGLKLESRKPAESQSSITEYGACSGK